MVRKTEADKRVFYTGFALAVAPDLWKGLSEKERTNVENWLGNSINEKKSVFDNRKGPSQICSSFALTDSHVACPIRIGSGSASLPTSVSSKTEPNTLKNV